jgi:hypothetical protein
VPRRRVPAPAVCQAPCRQGGRLVREWQGSWKIWPGDDEGVNLRETPHGTILKRLSFKTPVFVGCELPGDWYFVALEDGSFAYVARQYAWGQDERY